MEKRADNTFPKIFFIIAILILLTDNFNYAQSLFANADSIQTQEDILHVNSTNFHSSICQIDHLLYMHDDHSQESEYFSISKRHRRRRGMTKLNYLPEIEFSGFVDVGYSKTEDVNLNQIELCFGSDLTNKLTSTMAVLYEGHEEKFLFSNIFLEYYFVKNAQSNNRIKNLSIVAGKFDTPFGIDYNFYSPLDRKLITAPLTNCNTHNSFNEYGLMIDVQFNKLSSQLFIQQGCKTHGISLGMKNSYQLNDNYEIGFSFMTEDHKHINEYPHILCADFIFHIRSIEIKGEGIYSNGIMNVDDIYVNNGSGFYLEIDYHLFQESKIPLTLCSRFGNFSHSCSSDKSSRNSVKRYTLGLNTKLFERFITKLEFLFNDQNNNNSDQINLQLVAIL